MNILIYPNVITNIIQIISKMTRELNVTITQFKKIKKILLNKKLDGFKFENYSNSEFVKLFRSIRDVTSDIWSLIYDELMYWSFQEFETIHKVHWEEVGTVLWENDFMDDMDEINSCLDELVMFILYILLNI